MHALIRSRRTVHAFLSEPVADAVIEEALELARWAPNHHRTEPWRVYLLGAAARARIAHLNAGLVRAQQGERAAAVKLKRWLEMPGWLVVTMPQSGDARRAREDYAACCCAMQNFMLALWAAGVGVKWTTGQVIETPEFAAIVGFEHAVESVVGLFWYGRPAAPPAQQQRRPVADFLTRVE